MLSTLFQRKALPLQAENNWFHELLVNLVDFIIPVSMYKRKNLQRYLRFIFPNF